MDTDNFKSNLNTVKELILDENKIVTYISLSKELCIHVNDAKSLLHRIVKDIRKDRPAGNLYVCYIISGLQNNNCGITTVCTESDLDQIKKTLKLVFYEHVYCVSQGLKDADNAVLSSLNRFEDLSLCTGLIKGNICTKRTEDELDSLVSRNHAPIVESKTTNIQVKKPTDKAKENIKNIFENVSKVSTVKSEPKIKTETPDKEKVVQNNSRSPPKNSNSKTAGKGIAGFFNKSNGVASKAKTTTQPKSQSHVETTVKIKDEPLDSNSKSSPEVEKPSIKNSNEKSNNNKSLTQIKKNAKVDKKRKRVLHVSDSESDAEANDPFSNEVNEMDVDHESDDEIPPTPTINTVKITSGIVNPKKRRKIVDKTYTDEEGYILTKKVEVYESCSDNEENTKENDREIKENGSQEKNIKVSESNKHSTGNNNQVKQTIKIEISPKQNKKKKVSPPQKGKQATINSFFKKL